MRVPCIANNQLTTPSAQPHRQPGSRRLHAAGRSRPVLPYNHNVTPPTPNSNAPAQIADQPRNENRQHTIVAVYVIIFGLCKPPSYTTPPIPSSYLQSFVSHSNRPPGIPNPAPNRPLREFHVQLPGPRRLLPLRRQHHHGR